MKTTAAGKSRTRRTPPPTLRASAFEGVERVTERTITPEQIVEFYTHGTSAIYDMVRVDA